MPPSLQPPPRLFRQFERGELSREALQAAMAEHRRVLIREMEADALNPVAALMEHLRNVRAAARLRRRHGEAELREVFSRLSEIPDFEPANLLWNAGHHDVPLHCFLRHRREPVFRVLQLRTASQQVTIKVEYGAAESRLAQRELFHLERVAGGGLELRSRRRLP